MWDNNKTADLEANTYTGDKNLHNASKGSFEFWVSLLPLCVSDCFDPSTTLPKSVFNTSEYCNSKPGGMIAIDARENTKRCILRCMDPVSLSNNSAIHMTRLLNWMHDPGMVAAFASGVALGSQQKVIYVNPELFSVFQIMEQERIEEEEAEEEAEQELEAKMRAKKRKKKSPHQIV